MAISWQIKNKSGGVGWARPSSSPHCDIYVTCCV